MRIVSLATRNYPSITTNKITIYALRSDGQLFSASTIWPKGPSDDPRIFFFADPIPTPVGLRSIGYRRFVGVVGVTTSNQLLQRTDSGWVPLGNSNVVLLGASGAGGGITLLGTSGLSTSIGDLAGGTPPPSLPGWLALAEADPNVAFHANNVQLGRATPLAAGPVIAYALVPGTCTMGSLTPCIWRSNLSSSSSWSTWQPFATGDISDVRPYNMPWTIQEGTRFRGVDGEVWVIAGAQHLKFWAP